MPTGHELQPEQHAHPPGDMHRRLRLACGLRAGRHPGDARCHERWRLGLRGAPAIGLRSCPRRPRVLRGGRPGQRVVADGGVPDIGEQLAYGEAHGGVGGDR